MLNMEDELKRINDSLLEIRQALLGNEYNQGIGLVQKVSSLKSRVTKIERKFNNIFWLMVGSSIGGAGLIKLIEKIVLFVK